MLKEKSHHSRDTFKIKLRTKNYSNNLTTFSMKNATLPNVKKTLYWEIHCF